MANRREFPYIWATGLPRLLTSESSCEWAGWLKAHHQDWTRVPSNFDQTDWLIRHTTLLNGVRPDWQAQVQTGPVVSLHC